MILITGASGHVGRRAAERLAAEGHDVRRMARDPGRLPELPGGGERVAGDYADPGSLGDAFRGVRRALVVSVYGRPHERALLHRNAFEAAARAGVEHVVYLSFQGAAPDSRFPLGRDHHDSERYLQDTGLAHTALRDDLYLDVLPEMFDERGVVRGPAGQGRAAFVARDDVAAVAATILAADEPPTGPLDVTGPEALTFAEVAERLGRLTGRELRYEDESREAGRVWRAATGAPDWEVDIWLGSYEAQAAGELAAVSDTVPRLTGRPATSLEELFAKHPEMLDALR